MDSICLQDIYESDAMQDMHPQKPVDDNAPKEPLSPYLIWANEYREGVILNNPDWDLVKIFKYLKSMWSTMPEEEKALYEDEHVRACKAHQEELTLYSESKQYNDYKIKLLAWELRQNEVPFEADPNVPKRPKPSYQLFSEYVRPQIREEHPGVPMPEVFQMTTMWWDALKSDGKKGREYWMAEGRKEVVRYLRLCDEYKASKDHQSYLQKKKAFLDSQKEKRRKIIDSLRQDKPTCNKRKREGEESDRPKKARRIVSRRSRRVGGGSRKRRASRRPASRRRVRRRRRAKSSKKKRQRSRSAKRMRSRTRSVKRRRKRSRSAKRAARSRSAKRRRSKSASSAPRKSRSWGAASTPASFRSSVSTTAAARSRSARRASKSRSVSRRPSRKRRARSSGRNKSASKRRSKSAG